MRKKIQRFLDSGTIFVWICGGGLALSLLMITGLLLLIMVNGLGYFWPQTLVEFTLTDGSRVLGEMAGQETIPNSVTPETPKGKSRIRIKIGNRDLYGLDFKWVDEDRIATQRLPDMVISVERREWGKFFGRLSAIHKGDEIISQGEGDAWERLPALLEATRAIHEKIEHIEKGNIGEINHAIESIRLKVRGLDLKPGESSPERTKLQQTLTGLETEYETYASQLRDLYAELEVYTVVLADVSGREKRLPIGQIINVLMPNHMSLMEKMVVYAKNVWVVLSEEPREANTEGGIFPAIFGTVLMVILMSIAVVPFGVLAALYLREYARQGLIVRLVRIAVNNLAGVPSIVFGVFGLGFFVYAVGGSIDALFFSESLPNPTFGTGGILWASLTLALMTVPVVIVATEEGLAAVPKEYREGSLGLGATKFETLRRVVLPCAMPGILTGLILAISRATGEVAPLMLTGVVKLAPSLPLDSFFPFLHLDRKFMHLGFHIYDVGFQSPNVEAAKPMVFVTTLVLVLVVILLNFAAITIRNRMKKQYVGSAI